MPPDLKAKDGMMAMLGIWCIEFAEIEHLIRTDTETMKAVLSRSVERFRSPYERGMLQHPRQCIFIGTTNATDYLRDATGNRRIWPIACQHADEDWVAENREQLWAEAAMREASREIVWLEEDALEGAMAQQSDRMVEDPWHRRIAAYVETLSRIRSPELLAAPLDIPAGQMTRGLEMRVSNILKQLGWIAKRSNGDRWWEPPP
jgi:predicted P-loop ATPase